MSQLAFPLTAVLVLHAGVSDVAVLLLISGLSSLAGKSLATGLTVRTSARRLLIAGNLARAVLFAVPLIAIAADSFSMPILWAVACLTGAAGALVRPSVRTLLSALSRDDDDLIRNTRSLTRAYVVSGLIGVGAGGILISTLGPAAALVFDSATYVISSILVSVTQDVAPQTTSRPNTVTFHRPYRSSPAVSFALAVECIAATGLGLASAVWTIHLTNTLEIEPWAQGLLMGLGAAASLVGAHFSRSDLQTRPFWVLTLSTHLVGAILLFAVATTAAGALAFGFLAAQQILVSPLSTARDVSLASGRLLVTPQERQQEMEGRFYTFPLVAAAIGRAAAIPLSSLSSRELLSLATLPALAAAAAAAIVTVRAKRLLMPQEEPS